MKKKFIIMAATLSAVTMAHAGFVTSSFRDTIKISSPPDAPAGLTFLQVMERESGNSRISATIDTPTSMRIREDSNMSFEGAKFKIKIGYDATRYCYIHISDSSWMSKKDSIDVVFNANECQNLTLTYNKYDFKSGAFFLKFTDKTPAKILGDKNPVTAPA